ncbi:hypothetical protein D9M72_613870 [compost metagenome]
MLPRCSCITTVSSWNTTSCLWDRTLMVVSPTSMPVAICSTAVTTVRRPCAMVASSAFRIMAPSNTICSSVRADGSVSSPAWFSRAATPSSQTSGHLSVQ